MSPWIVDEDDQPIRFRVKGYDRAEPDKVVVCQMEARPGGMCVLRMVDDRVYGQAPPPPMAEDIPPAKTREERAEEGVAREREAARLEREAKEQQDRLRAETRARSKTSA